MTKYSKIYKVLERLYNSSPVININDSDKIVIFSDLHLGNGGYQDDFRQNSDLFRKILLEYYLENDYTLVLNGDIEELYKFRINQIQSAWSDVFEIFHEFKKKNKLIKIFGNHDYELHKYYHHGFSNDLLEGVRLNYQKDTLFIYHGHQTSSYLEDYNRFSSWFGRYILNPIGYKNITLPVDDASKFKTEKIAYNFASSKKVISVLGHTHRPLFESHSRIDSIKLQIEFLIARLNGKKIENTEIVIDKIKFLKLELENIYKEKNDSNHRNSLYNDKLMVPCLFNSGSVIGKRGSTGIEIKNGNISLVYWFDQRRSNRYLNYEGVKSKRLNNSDYFKAIFKKDKLESIFLRIKLLS